MRIEVDVPEYSREHGLAPLGVELGAIIGTAVFNGKLVISANSAGPISLAIHLLALAQGSVPIGRDTLYGDWNWLESGSSLALIRKIEALQDAFPRPLEGEARAIYEYITDRLSKGAVKRDDLATSADPGRDEARE